MTANRRNHYRLLQVQPEATPEVIKASWRTLMHTNRGHPDLGGDPAAAALINEAYRVLSDPERRRAYDAGLDVARLRGAATGRAQPGPARAGAGAGRASAPAGAGDATTRPAQPRSDPLAWRVDRVCPLCRAALPPALRADSRCGRCDAPLGAAPAGSAAEREMFGRRAARRGARDDAAEIRSDWRGAAIPARLVDLSTGGAGLVSSAPVATGTAIRVVLPTLDAVARVVDCHRLQAHWRVRVQWLTARPLGVRGVYVSVRA